MDLSIIFVNFNTFELTSRALNSVINNVQKFSYEIILVDNGSTDGSVEKLISEFSKDIAVATRNTRFSEARIKVLRSEENLGFSAANNLGIKISSGEYILLLNSDTEVKSNSLNLCLEKIKMENQNILLVGALGCKLILSDGKLDHACKRGFPTPLSSFLYFSKLYKLNPKILGKYLTLELDENSEGETDSLTGAFMLMPKRVLDEVGTLDEDFFMYGEDIDLCFRIKKAGYKVLYFPSAEVFHFKGGSSKNTKPNLIREFHRSMWIFYKKHYWKKYSKILGMIVFLGIFLKYQLERFKLFLI